MSEPTQIPGYEGYFASSDGVIWTGWERIGCGPGNGRGSHSVVGKSRTPLTQYSMPALKEKKRLEYLYVRMRTGPNQYKSVMVHKLIALTFIGPRPEGLESRHLNGNHKDNCAANLCYGTKKENADDRVRHGTSPVGEKHPLARLTEMNVKDIRQRSASGVRTKVLANEYGMTMSAIRRAVKRKSWSHVA